MNYPELHVYEARLNRYFHTKHQHFRYQRSSDQREERISPETEGAFFCSSDDVLYYGCMVRTRICWKPNVSGLPIDRVLKT